MLASRQALIAKFKRQMGLTYRECPRLSSAVKSRLNQDEENESRRERARFSTRGCRQATTNRDPQLPELIHGALVSAMSAPVLFFSHHHHKLPVSSRLPTLISVC